MKKLAKICLIFMLAAMFCVAISAKTVYVAGDVTGDGKTTLADVIRVIKHIL